MPDLVIDTQHHYVPPGYHAALTAAAQRSSAFAEANELFVTRDADHPVRRLLDRLPEMESAGIDLAVLSIPPPSAPSECPEGVREAIRAGNDELLEVCEQHPERFVMLAGLPLPDVAAATAELDRLAGRTAVRGLCVGVDALRFKPDAIGLEPVLERAAGASWPLVVHPAGHHPGPGATFDDYMLGAALETMVWTSVVALRFVLSGLLDLVPGLDLVVPHLGGVIPYLTQRLIDQTAGSAEHDLTHYLRHRVYTDNCSFHPPALRCAIETLGAERIMLGSDYPFRGALHRCVDDVNGADVDEAGKRSMLGGTASRWFGPGGGDG